MRAARSSSIASTRGKTKRASTNSKMAKLTRCHRILIGSRPKAAMGYPFLGARTGGDAPPAARASGSAYRPERMKAMISA